MRFAVVTLFPEMLKSLTDFGVVARAARESLLQVEAFNPRDYTQDNYRKVDDRPFGGGPGMVLMAEPLTAAIKDAKQAKPAKVIYLSPQGVPFTQQKAEELAKLDNLVLVAGRYEGIDQRVIESSIDEEISIGDFVVSGGELPAMMIIDAVSRLLPNVLGHSESAKQDSFSSGLLDCPHYTRPEDFKGQKVPDVLLSGHHADIETWRMKMSLGQTWLRRPELLENIELTEEQHRLLADFQGMWRATHE